MILIFCFKQKTAYEIRISDGSSDVCSSDLIRAASVRLPSDTASPLSHYGDRRGHTQQRRVRMTSESRRDPLKDHLLTPENSAFIIIDYQPIQVSSIRSMDQEEMVFTIVSTATAAVNYNLPIDRKSVVEGKYVSVRVDLGGRR